MSDVDPPVSLDNLTRLLDRHAAQRGDCAAIITSDDVVMSWAALRDDVLRVARGLRDLGVRRGERVLLVLDDTPAFPTTFLACLRLGAVPVPVNFLSTADDFAFYVVDAGAVVVVVDAAFAAVVVPKVRAHATVVVANGVHDDARTLSSWLSADAAVDVEPVAMHDEDPCFWLYSSGSTGRPKGVVHLHKDIPFTCAHYAVPVLGINADDVCFSTTKLFHAYGLGNALTFPLWVGATSAYLTGRPTPKAVLARAQAVRPTIFYSVPTLYTALLADDGLVDVVAAGAFARTRHGTSAAEPLPAEIFKRFKAATGVEILDGIGSTEMLHIYCSNRAGAVRPGTSGTAVDGYTIEIRDDAGHVVDHGVSGELWAKGGSLFPHYWHRLDKTRASFVGEWFRTGDRYHRDEVGCLVYEGRIDDMIKVGGLWISPIEIENRLMEHPAVREAGVVAVLHDGLTTTKAFITLASTDHDDAALLALTTTLQTWCKDGLRRYQYPHLVEFVAELPKTATGKIQRFRLRER